jgi:hypothetical protein
MEPDTRPDLAQATLGVGRIGGQTAPQENPRGDHRRAPPANPAVDVDRSTRTLDLG